MLDKRPQLYIDRLGRFFSRILLKRRVDLCNIFYITLRWTTRNEIITSYYKDECCATRLHLKLPPFIHWSEHVFHVPHFCRYFPNSHMMNVFPATDFHEWGE